MISMQSIVNELVNALREELKTYGGILALLDQQQESVMNRSADGVIGAAQQIQVQMKEVEDARRNRESWRASTARALSLAENATFQEMLPKLPADYRPLIQALVEENNHLLVRVQQRTRQNHLLLHRSVELMQTFLSTLFPREDTPTYNVRGGVTPAVAPFRPLYEAVG